MDDNTALVILGLIGVATFLGWTWITHRYVNEPEDDED